MSDDTDFSPDYYGKDLLSASWVNTWLKCQRMYGYAKVAGIRTPPGWAMAGGSAMDATLNEHLDQRIKGVNGLRGTALVDYYQEKLKFYVEKYQPQGPRDADLEVDGARLLPLYEREVSPKIEPVAVQKEVRIKIGDRDFVAHIDLLRASTQRGGVIVSDHKFTGKSPSPNKASSSLQLKAYDFVTNDPGHQVELINLVRLKREPRIVVQPYTVTDRDRQEFLQTVRWVSMLTATNIYPMTDASNWVCSPQWCGYYSRCRGRASGPELIPGEVR